MNCVKNIIKMSMSKVWDTQNVEYSINHHCVIAYENSYTGKQKQKFDVRCHNQKFLYQRKCHAHKCHDEWK